MKNIVKQIITIPLVKVVLYIIKYRTITRWNIIFAIALLFYSSAIACCIFSTLVIFDITFYKLFSASKSLSLSILFLTAIRI